MLSDGAAVYGDSFYVYVSSLAQRLGICLLSTNNRFGIRFERLLLFFQH